MEEKDFRGWSSLYWYSLKSLLEERFPPANAISLTAFLSPVRMYVSIMHVCVYLCTMYAYVFRVRSSAERHRQTPKSLRHVAG